MAGEGRSKLFICEGRLADADQCVAEPQGDDVVRPVGEHLEHPSRAEPQPRGSPHRYRRQDLVDLRVGVVWPRQPDPGVRARHRRRRPERLAV